MAFIHDNQPVVAGIIDINGLGDRHNVGLQVIALAILVPHILQVGRTDNERTAGVGHLVDLGDGTSGDGLTQSNHVTNHRSASFLTVQMAGGNLHGCLLEVEQFALKLWGQRKLLHATTGIGTQMIGGLQINIIRWDNLFTSPTVVDGIYQFLGDVDAEAVVPSVVKPFGKCLQVAVVLNVGIEFALLGQS